MSEDEKVKATAARLRQLIDAEGLSEADRGIAEHCQRRLEQPLRLTVFGTDTRHAVSLINLIVGQPVIAPSISRARINFFYGEEPHARLQFRDGSRQRLEGSEFRRLFDDNPSWIRMYVNLPVLKKLSLLLATESNPRSLCADVGKTLPATDIALWAGDELSEPLANAWDTAPEHLRNHSYLVLSPFMDITSWQPIASEFVDVLRVDPNQALDAKAAEGGVDKETFRASGGASVVRMIKKEIDLLVNSALDAGEVLLMRNAELEPQAELPATPQDDPEVPVQLGKLASRSRLLGKSTSGPQITQRTVSMAIKNMPRNVTKNPKRVRSRRTTSGPATPWSLGL